MIITYTDKQIKHFEETGEMLLTNEQKAQREVQRHNAEIYEKIAHLKNYLNTDWRWRMERLNAETAEIEMGLRASRTESLETLIQDRKKAVDEINKLEEQLNGQIL